VKDPVDDDRALFYFVEDEIVLDHQATIAPSSDVWVAGDSAESRILRQSLESRFYFSCEQFGSSETVRRNERQNVVEIVFCNWK